jgi:hypothetical protein
MNETHTMPLHPLLARLSGVELLIALGALFVALPLLDDLRSGTLIESILFTIVLILAVLAISDRSRVVAIAALLAAPTLIGRWLNQYWPAQFPPEIFLIGAILLVAFVIIHFLRFVLHAPVVNSEVLCASISAYLLLSLAWTFAYWLVAELIPRSFSFNAAAGSEQSINGFNGLYFSIITLTTLGYGDITPVSKVARMLAAIEAMTGLLYVAVLIARLVAIQSATNPRSNEN